MEKEITIYDIAKKIGLSPSTVSRALHDHPALKVKTKQRVIDAAREMGYRSNTFACNLRKQKSQTIGVIVPRLNSHFQSSVIAGIEKVANEAGYNLIISQSLGSVQKEISNAKAMFHSRIDGLLISLAYETENIDHFEPFITKNIPVVFFDNIAEHQTCKGIAIDNVQAAYTATTHLLAQGCVNIVHVTGSQKKNVYSDRLTGYKYALMDYHIPFKESSVLIKDFSEECGMEAAEEILNMKKLPDGIFVANDGCAVSLMGVLKQAGLSVPRDIAVVGFNNDPVSEVIEPSLTTVNYPGYEMGEMAVRQMINQLNGTPNSLATKSITLRSELIIRESSLKSEYAGGKVKEQKLPLAKLF